MVDERLAARVLLPNTTTEARMLERMMVIEAERAMADLSGKQMRMNAVG